MLSVRLARPFLDLLLPPLCLACGGRRESRTARICDSCRREIRDAGENLPLFVETASAIRAEGDITAFASAFVFEKQGPLQVMLHALKYGGVTAVGEELGTALGERIATAPWGARVTTVVPVPLHRVKQRERGYNQAGIIAGAVGRRLGLPVDPGMLVRSRHTVTQTHLGAAARKENVAGAFAVPAGQRAAVAGARVLLVDDVATTGATLCEAARALADAGAAECFAGTAAIAAL